ncbi:HAD family phosphatase [Olsenella uli]|uniref:HAD family hydrolase n=1 Tax=Olsenella uli TaxID=133926 RepID=UPI00045018EC|nr:HAD family hydrolase [Olsenella uli]EUB31951.1 HAD hydrolase, family IB [Olsenella uli MSTE5]
MSQQRTYSPQNPARLAVFDFDGTTISGQSGSLFSRYLFARGYLSLSSALRLGWWGARYVLHLPYRQNESREIIFSALSERTPGEVRALMRGFHDAVLLRRYRPAAMDEVRHCRDEGCVTLLVSATFRDIAQAAAQYLGVDGLVATDMERSADGGYTGEVEGEVVAGPAKTRAVVRWADEHLGKGNWVIAYAYGDHHSDKDLLGAADKPFAVSPGASLKHTSKKRNWEILDWK